MSPFKFSSTPLFCKLFAELPELVEDAVVEAFDLLKIEPDHPSLGFCDNGKVWTVNIGETHRAIAHKVKLHLFWFWIGTHEEYNKLLNRRKPEELAVEE